jgi:uncharacterized membrane protein
MNSLYIRGWRQGRMKIRKKDVIVFVAIIAFFPVLGSVFITITAGWSKKDQQVAATFLMVFIIAGIWILASLKERIDRRKQKKMDQYLTKNRNLRKTVGGRGYKSIESDKILPTGRDLNPGP